MRVDVFNHVKRCAECQLHKVPQRAPSGLMGHREIEGPWSTVAADIMGPFPPSKNQNRYLLVFEDLFIKYIEIKPLRKATAVSIMKAFEELIVFKWGSPKYLLTDNGTEFSNNHTTAKLAELGIIQTFIAPYHAQANPVERVNRTLKTMISMFVKNDHREWDTHTPEFAFALNTSVHASTKVSPAFLNFGRNPNNIRTYQHSNNPSFSLSTMRQEDWAE